MAGGASHLLVPASQGERRGPVLHNRERGWREPRHAMARTAVCRFPAEGRLAAVGVGMTRRAGRERGIAIRKVRAVTAFARDGTMLPLQRVSRERVIESFPFDYAEPARDVALAAIGREASLVRILMTARALAKGHRLELRHPLALPVGADAEARREMALVTRDVHMLARERVARALVVEFRRRFPVPGIVAAFALRTQCVPVHIVVTMA